MDRFLEPAQINASITKDATGMDFNKVITGSSNSLKTGKQYPALPSARPAAKAIRNPALIFPKDEMMDCQNSSEGIRLPRAFTASHGPTMIIGLSTAADASCQTIIHKHIISTLRQVPALFFFIYAPMEDNRIRRQEVPLPQKTVPVGTEPPDIPAVSLSCKLH